MEYITQSTCLKLVSLWVILLIVNKKYLTPKLNNEDNFMYNTECPMCLNYLVIPVKSSCGHAFCLDCLYAYTKINYNKRKYLCPYCRTHINKLSIIKNPQYNSLQESQKIQIEKKLKKLINLQLNGFGVRKSLKILVDWSTPILIVFLWFYFLDVVLDVALYYVNKPT